MDVTRESTGYAVRNAGLRFAGSLLSLPQGGLCCKITLISLHNYAARPMLLYIMIKIQISPRFLLINNCLLKDKKRPFKICSQGLETCLFPQINTAADEQDEVIEILIPV